MPPTKIHRPLHEPEFMPSRFNRDPGEALAYAEMRVFERHSAEAFRASLAFFEEMRPRSAALPWLQRLLGLLNICDTRGERGPSRNPRPILDVKALAFCVYGSSLTSAGDHHMSDQVISRARTFKPSGRIKAVVDIRHAIAVLELFRFREAQTMTERAVKTMKKDDGSLMPFGNRDRALLARCQALFSSYLYAGSSSDTLVDAARDAGQALSSPYSEIVASASHMLVLTAAGLSLEGLPTPDCPKVVLPQGKRERACSKWSRALFMCAQERWLKLAAETNFRQARKIFLLLDLGFDAIQVTIDLQFWMIVSGDTRRAASESPLILDRISAVADKTQREAISLWVTQIEHHRLSLEIADRVLREVRGLKSPKNLHSLICSRS